MANLNPCAHVTNLLSALKEEKVPSADLINAGGRQAGHESTF